MAFSGGVYTLPTPALVPGQTVSSSENNTVRNDMAASFNLTFLRNGTSTATANLPMGGYKLTGLGVATTIGDALSYNQAAVVSDLTAAGTVTITSGTANGVAYLNGSKVLTSGSALTFDGTNLGVGVTPSAWATLTGLQVKNAALSGYSNDMYLTANSYYGSGGNTYIANAAASMYQQTAGAHKWFNAPSGTAGNAISFTQAMTLDASGNLGIGATSPTARIHSNASIKADQNVFSGDGYAFVFGSGTTSYWTGSSSTNYIAGFTNGSERMRIDSSGNVGIGTSSPNLRLCVGGVSSAYSSSNIATFVSANVGQFNGSGQVSIVTNNATAADMGGSLGFHAYDSSVSAAYPCALVSGRRESGTGGNFSSYFAVATSASNGSLTEKMRIDSSGNLLVGITGVTGSKMQVAADSGNVVYFRNTAGTGIYLVSGNSSWSTVSDERLKTTLLPFENAAEKVASLRSGIGRYLTDKEDIKRSFLIAQDVQKVLPEAISVQDDDQGTLGLQYTDVIPLLVAAIKELKAELDAIKAEVAALKTVA